MSKKLFLSVIVITLLFSTLGFSQDGVIENVGMSTKASAVLGHPRGVESGFSFGPNKVEWTWRHCQKYVTQTGHLWWKKSKLTEEGKQACAADPSTIYRSETNHNVTTTVGIDKIMAQVSGAASATAVCKWIAVSDAVITPAAGDTTLSGEITTNGLGRANPSPGYAHTAGQNTYTITHTFTFTGTQSSRATAVFDAISSGTMCFEANYTGGAVSGNANDTLQVTWTVQVS